MTQSTLISSPEKAPTVLTIREGGGIVLSQRRNLVVLDSDELARLIAATRPESVTPARARMLRYPATPKPAAKSIVSQRFRGGAEQTS